jgi:hypothetical protein
MKPSEDKMATKTKTLLSLVGLGLVDLVIPVPILALILIHVVLNRPPWFIDRVRDLYNTP